MIDLIAKYRSQFVFGISPKQLKQLLEDNTKSNGFFLKGRYYPCVCELFAPIEANKRFKYPNKKCYTVIKTLGLSNMNIEEYSCNNCLARCIENLTSDNPKIKLKNNI